MSSPAIFTPTPTGGEAGPNFRWKVELPDLARGDDDFGGCRGVELCYERGQVIGEGTYGHVYLATNK